MDLTFAPAEKADIDAIYHFSKALIDTYEDLQRIDYEKVLAWVRRKIENNIGEYICVYRDGRKTGYYRLSPAGGMMEIDDLYIFPECRGQGIGTAVIEKCCGETDLPVMLYVFTRNTGAFSLYQRLGFRVTETIGESRCIMVREVPDEKHIPQIPGRLRPLC